MTGTAIPVIQNVPSLIRRGQVGRVSIQLFDENSNPVDASSLTLAIHPGGEDYPIFTEDFFEQLIYPFVHRIIKPTGTIGTYFIDWGDVGYPAVVTGVGGTFPTGFVGGEQLQMNISGNVQVVTFAATDQSLAQVVSKINSVWGPVLGINMAAQVAGQLQLSSRQKGLQGSIAILGTPPVLAKLGLVSSFTSGVQRYNETTCTQEFLFAWKATDGAHPDEVVEVLQTVYVLPGQLYQLLPLFRLEVDKAVKLVDQKNGVFLGYSDAQLVQWLLGGLQAINGYQPSIFFSPDTFPYQMFGQILIEAALLWAMMSQSLFSVDSDIPSYNDQGQSFVINHQPALAAMLRDIAARLDKNIPLFKLHFVKTGTVLTEAGPSFRLQQILSAAPSGSLFRNLFQGGPS